ncbi:fumarylacetoacetate hydrolase family protein [Bordetella bronchiseptica]|uniref:5-carboxymethyl-2-hydroxymuconate isomerase n=1 Tax=Bordetella genomosp. 6 TaxID=463024 RepID=A0ABX4FAT7_9BORD|nr:MULTISPECIES: fumarylacetoacetate hydrolase family protein [Bordetella]KCV65654.1 FAH family protein [Bordetella bronchiseptica 99-R-0433]OZI75438.1 5-carboxymethyl-2-hydroxymuconate isomerase [Bordetella genomosp. 6]
MKLVSYLDRTQRDPQPSYGAVVGERIIDLATPQAPTLRAALARDGVDGLAARLRQADGAAGLALADATLLAPITDPDKILCIGLNYRLHAEEAGMAIPARPSTFVRFAGSLAAQGQPVLRPAESDQFDYEAELAVIIGRPARRVSEARAMEHVAGYACLAENSVRDWQRHSTQATPGKNFVRSGAFGPWLVTADEAGAPEAMTVIGRLNGETVQHDSVANMIFTVAQLVSYLSTFAELLPGDVIATGTPAGVGMSRKPPRYLRPGDVFEVDISGVGVLRNPVDDDSR